MRELSWIRWTAAEIRYLIAHADASNDSIAVALGRCASAVRRKRYALGLKLSPERRLAIRQAAAGRQKNIWPPAQKRVLEEHGREFLNVYGSECDRNLKPLVDATGPSRTLNAIQLMRSNLGIIETKENLISRMKKAHQLINFKKRQQIPSTLAWEDLSPIARAVLLGSLLGDGGVYEANGTHYYSETHKSTHREYLIWKTGLLPQVFHGRLRERNPQLKDARCIRETGVSHIFTFLREQFYIDAKRGFKTIVSEWVINRIDLVALLIWFLDDGRNNRRSNGFPNLEIAVPRWTPEHLAIVCEVLNTKYDLHLYTRQRTSRSGMIDLIIPAKDRDSLLPKWWDFSDAYNLPECMRYKIPRYNPAKNGSRRLHWEETFGTDVHGLRTVVLHCERVVLAKTAFAMRQIGTPLETIGAFLAAKGHPITPRYLHGVWERLSM
jgi:hypothetical protein